MNETETTSSVVQLAMTPTAWTKLPHISDVQPLGPADHAVLEEIHDVLRRHGALERFGVTLVHRHYELEEGEVVVEAAGSKARQQVLEVRPEAEVLREGNVIATQWIFAEQAETVVCRLYCQYEDYAHRNRHATIP